MISVIVFSKDRSLQLDAYLESLLLWSGIKQEYITVLYKDGPVDYDSLIEKFPSVHWIRESVFAEDLSQILSTANEYIMFGCDDVIFTGNMDFHLVQSILAQDRRAIGFSFRLGKNIEHQKHFEVLSDGTIKWDWTIANAPLHWDYPFELDATLYRREIIQEIVEGCPWEKVTNPNYFEQFGSQFAKESLREKYPGLYAYSQSRALVITVNRVQDTHQNGFDDSQRFSVERLDTLYQQGFRLDLGKISRKKNKHIHVGADYIILHKEKR